MKQKGFSVIELLVVVAIIGILAAVGVVAYNGYTKGARISVTKNNHNNLKKFIQAQFAKCPEQIGPLRTSATGPVFYTMPCPPEGDATVYVGTILQHFKFEDWRNPYDNSTLAVKSNCYDADGCTQLTATSTPNAFSITSYYKNKDNTPVTIGPDTINIE